MIIATNGVNIALASKGTTSMSSGDTVAADRHELRFVNDGDYGNSRSWMSSEHGGGWVALEFAEDAGKPAKDGKGGREIRAPLSDIGAATMANLGFTAEAIVTGHQRPRMGNDIFGAFGRDFTTKDGEKLMLLAITPKQWSKALEALDIGAAVTAVEAELTCAMRAIDPKA